MDGHAHLPQHPADGPVPLLGVRVQSLHGDAVPVDGPHAQPGGGVGPVPFHNGPAGRAVGLRADDPARFHSLRRHAKGGQGLDGELKIAGGFQFPLDLQNALLPQQGQREEQAGEELRRNISRQAIGSGGELAGDRQGLLLRV